MLMLYEVEPEEETATAQPEEFTLGSQYASLHNAKLAGATVADQTQPPT